MRRKDEDRGDKTRWIPGEKTLADEDVVISAGNLTLFKQELCLCFPSPGEKRGEIKTLFHGVESKQKLNLQQKNW